MAGIGFDTLNSAETIKAALADSCVAANLTVLSTGLHSFEPHGLTAFSILSESHISIHTWPERGYAAIDVFTCGRVGRAVTAADHLALTLGASSRSVRIVKRGTPGTSEEHG